METQTAVIKKDVVPAEIWQAASTRFARISIRQVAINQTWIEQAGDLLAIQKSVAQVDGEDVLEFQVLGYATFEDFLACPEINISRETAYLYMRIYAHYVDFLNCDTVLMARAGVSKLAMIHRNGRATKKEVDLWLERACELSRSDLGRELRDAGFGYTGYDAETEPAYRFDDFTVDWSWPAVKVQSHAIAYLLNTLTKLDPSLQEKPFYTTAVQILQRYKE